MPEKEMLSASKLAEQWGVSEKAVKDAVVKSGVSPDVTRGKCKLYSPATAAKIKKMIPA